MNWDLLVGFAIGAGMTGAGAIGYVVMHRASPRLSPEMLRDEMRRVINVEAVDSATHQRRIEMMRAGARTQRAEPNPNPPAVIHPMRRRRTVMRLPETDQEK